MRLTYTWAVGLGLLLRGSGAWGQTYNIGANQNYSAPAGQTVVIASGLTYTGQLTIPSNNVTVVNNGTVTGTITVQAGATGTVINNNSQLSTNNLIFGAPVTLNNGSPSATSAAWSGYLTQLTAATTITNYGSVTAQVVSLGGGTVTNQSGATWSGSQLTTQATLAITNAGTWSTQVAEAGSSPTISITQNGGTWTGGVGGGSGSLRITNNASWTQPFNFPSGGNNLLETAAGATSALSGYLGTGSGTVALVNNGTLSMSGMGSLGATSSLTTAYGSTMTLTGDFYNYGTITNRGTIQVSHDFQNYASGVIKGATTVAPGRFAVANYTVNAGAFGADGSYLDFCDGTPNGTSGFDVVGGTIGPNVSYCRSTNPLPVVLVSFTGQATASGTQLAWLTASELQSAYFAVERSADGRAYVAVGRVAAAGSSASPRRYQYLDADAPAGPSYYRLRQVDQDGTSTYSPVVSVSRAAAEFLPPYPNPTTGDLTLDLRPIGEAAASVTVRDLLGTSVLTATLPGGRPQQLSLAHLPAGLYVLQVQCAGRVVAAQRIRKQ